MTSNTIKFNILTAFVISILLYQGCAPLIIAHRGVSAIAPENTKASIELAWKLNAPAAECDVRLTADNKIVLMHDPNTQRTASVNYTISETNYSDLLSLDVGSFKSAAYANERIPLLADVLETIPPGKKLFVEIKCGREILPYLEQTINESGKRSSIVIISFNIDVVTESKKQMPDIPTYWLVMTEKNEKGEWIPHSSELIRRAKKRNLDGLDLHWAGLSKEFVQEAHKAHLKIFTWTVDDVAIAKKLKDMGVDGITTNKPYLLMKNI